MVVFSRDSYEWFGSVRHTHYTPHFYFWNFMIARYTRYSGEGESVY